MNKSLYVTNENQELLWNTIHKTPQIHKLDNFYPGYKDTWFKNIIKSFHEKHPNISDTITLQKINRETIKYMIDHLNNNQTVPLPPALQQQPNSTVFMGKEAEKAKKQEIYNRAFEERQKQYYQMFEKPPLPEIDFTEKLEDEPINNMTELIEKHRKEREDEIHKIALNHNILPTQYGINAPTPVPTLISNLKPASSETSLPTHKPIDPITEIKNMFGEVLYGLKTLDERLRNIENEIYASKKNTEQINSIKIEMENKNENENENENEIKEK